jgi:hypothetical protein
MVAVIVAFAAGAFAEGAFAQTRPSDDTDIAPGFKLRSSGGIDIGDMYLEVVQFDANWKETEQHDVFKPTAQPATQPSSKVLTGDFAVPGGSFTLTEQIDPSDAGVHFSADMSSDKEITTNEMSIAVSLPVATFGGKQITIDGEPLAMPQEPAKKGEPHIFDKEDAHEIDLPTPAGTLQIMGKDLSILVQDDREWGDQRYALRIHFSPDDGAIKDSKIDLQMKWKPAGN